MLAEGQEPQLESGWRLPCQGPRGVMKVGDGWHRGGGRRGATWRGDSRPQFHLEA